MLSSQSNVIHKYLKLFLTSIMAILFLTSFSACSSSEVEVVLDSTKFIIDEISTVSEEQLIEMLGEPESIEEWNHLKSETLSYPIKTLYYENDTYAYHFNKGLLQRISIDSVEIPYANKNEILPMFGLKKYSNTSIAADTGVSYRVKNCGVPDFWIAIMDENHIKSIRISYGTVFL